MGAANFAYENRCIVVTNDDWEFGNVPPLKKECYDYNRNYPSTELKVSDDFSFWDIVLTSGYYEHGCIDYVRNCYSVEDEFGWSGNYETLKEFYDAVRKEYPQLTEYRLRKLCGKVSDFKNLDYFIDNAYVEISDYLARIEEIKVNQYLDGVKQNYGYEDICCVGRFSNGEALYQIV